MSLTTTVNKVIFQGNDVTTVFPYTFIIPLATDVVLTLTNTVGTQTVLSTAQYSITGIGSAGGGNVTYPLSGSALATGETLTLQRVVPYTQPTVLTNQGGYYPDVVEGADDNIVMQTQQLKEITNRAIVANPADTVSFGELPVAVQRANLILGFDGSGNILMYTPSITLFVVSVEVVTATAGQTLVPVATTYTPGNDTLRVYRNGLLQENVVDYDETTANSITFTSGLSVGDKITFAQGVIT